jgi:prepilin-type N-terminal cleavage/methylation domain-containing protein
MLPGPILLQGVPMNAPSTRRAGFTLIELLAVIAILGLLMGLAVPLISNAKATANQNACAQQLRQIAGNLQLWADTRNKNNFPKESGPRFLLVLVRDEMVSLKDADSLFRCPGTDDETRSPDDKSNPASGIKDFQNFDKNCISYAGRDNKTFKLDKNKLGDEPIASDDNDGRANHKHLTNVVFADGKIETIDVSTYKSELPEGQDWVTVGPDSPCPELKKMLSE